MIFFKLLVPIIKFFHDGLCDYEPFFQLVLSERIETISTSISILRKERSLSSCKCLSIWRLGIYIGWNLGRFTKSERWAHILLESRWCSVVQVSFFIEWIMERRSICSCHSLWGTTRQLWLIHNLSLQIIEVKKSLFNFNICSLATTCNSFCLCIFGTSSFSNCLDWLGFDWVSVFITVSTCGCGWSFVTLSCCLITLTRSNELWLFRTLSQWHCLSICTWFLRHFVTWSKTCRIEQAFQHYEVFLISSENLGQVFSLKHVWWTRRRKCGHFPFFTWRYFPCIVKWYAIAFWHCFWLTQRVFATLEVVYIINSISVEAICVNLLSSILFLLIWFWTHCIVSRKLLWINRFLVLLVFLFTATN